MARRACLISASRIFTIRPLPENPNGSNPTSPAYVPSNDSGDNSIGNHLAIRGFFRLSGVTYMDEISDLGVNALAALSDANESKSISKSPLSDDFTGLSEAKVETALSVGGVSDVIICTRFVIRRMPCTELNAVADDAADTASSSNRELVIVDGREWNKQFTFLCPLICDSTRNKNNAAAMTSHDLKGCVFALLLFSYSTKNEKSNIFDIVADFWPIFFCGWL